MAAVMSELQEARGDLALAIDHSPAPVGREAIGRLERAARAEAWDEGYQQGIRDQEMDVQHGADNPYRGGTS